MTRTHSFSAVAVLALMLLGAGCQSAPATNNQPTPTTTSLTPESNQRPSTPGSYEIYDEAKLSRAKTGKVVLYFYAPWCPSCQTLDTDIRSKLNSIPHDLSLLIVDYDSATDLKKKYGVTYQHTFIQVDERGSLKHKWSGSGSLESILTQLK